MTHSAKRRKSGRLSRSSEFDRVYKSGRSQANRWLVLVNFPRDDQEESRFGISVSRKVGGAVDRNKVKRAIREAINEHQQDFPPGYDFVIVARTGLRDLIEQEGSSGVWPALTELIPVSNSTSSDSEQSSQ